MASLDIGEIIGVQSGNTFLAKLYTDRQPVRRFDLVEFRYSMDDSRRIFKGMIIDNYLLDEQQWIRILTMDEILEALGNESHSEIGVDDVFGARVLYALCAYWRRYRRCQGIEEEYPQKRQTDRFCRKPVLKTRDVTVGQPISACR